MHTPILPGQSYRIILNLISQFLFESLYTHPVSYLPKALCVYTGIWHTNRKYFFKFILFIALVTNYHALQQTKPFNPAVQDQFVIYLKQCFNFYWKLIDFFTQLNTIFKDDTCYEYKYNLQTLNTHISQIIEEIFK